MSLLEAIQSKELDIYISLFFTLLGLGLGVIVDSIRNKGPSVKNQQGNFFNLTVNNVINLTSPPAHRPQDEQELVLFICFLSIILGIIYLFLRSEVLYVLSSITIFSISLWAGGTLHGLYKGYLRGSAWFFSLVFASAFCAANLFLVNKAFSPDYAPRYFQYSQEIINRYGVTGLSNYFNKQDALWFVFHLAGVCLLFLAEIRMTLFSIYFLAARKALRSESAGESWIVRRTNKYANPNKNILYVTLLSVIAYYFISGKFFMWFEYSFPVQFGNLIDFVLYGRG
ncbi:hypothetical protein DDT52_18935 [Brenneria roseae subsp. roseae]|uniref:hypothetical protein n=1 Tax=Brenneria roseae TaxID=1509241 RepID=UPI000D60F6DD|nr:hypothetical protein [Brenneria roseae]PWC16281.1 hypothetical protein DDT52_18935 [Brenneria roseae subsp. roseae]